MFFNPTRATYWLNDSTRRLFSFFVSDKLLDVIDNRPVAILLPGPSIAEFISRKKEFNCFDWCWASMNKFWVIEREQPLDMVIITCPDTCKQYRDKINAFPGLLITDQQGFKNSYFYGYKGDIDLNLNTLFIFLALLIDKGIKNIFLFGADGAALGSNHYFSNEYPAADFALASLPHQTEYLNKLFPDYSNSIINCSINSHYTRFKRVSYDQLLNDLNSE